MEKQTVLKVPGMHCDHCEASVRGALTALRGVASVSVDLATKDVRVSYDAGAVDEAALRAAIEDVGFDVA